MCSQLRLVSLYLITWAPCSTYLASRHHISVSVSHNAASWVSVLSAISARVTLHCVFLMSPEKTKHFFLFDPFPAFLSYSVIMSSFVFIADRSYQLRSAPSFFLYFAVPTLSGPLLVQLYEKNVYVYFYKKEEIGLHSIRASKCSTPTIWR